MGVRRTRSVTSSDTNSLWHLFIKITCSVFQFLCEVSVVGIIDREVKAERWHYRFFSVTGMDTKSKALRWRKVYRKSNQNPELSSCIFKLKKITRKIISREKCHHGAALLNKYQQHIVTPTLYLQLLIIDQDLETTDILMWKQIQ